MLSFERLKEAARNLEFIASVNPNWSHGRNSGLNDDETEMLADQAFNVVNRGIHELIDFYASRQSVKSEDVAEAIEYVNDWRKESMTFDRAVGILPPTSEETKAYETILTALQAYQPWVSVDDRLPEIPEGRYGVMCNVMVDNCSSTKVMSLLYEKDTVRGKTVCRWKWYGKISPWNVTHWKPLSEPPKGKD